MPPEIMVVKADGTRETFHPSKLRDSLVRSGADEDVVSTVVETIESNVEDGMSTDEIYRTAFRLLREHARPAASRYSLRRALFDLGPTGFPFEVFVAEIFRGQGFVAHTGVMVPGKCVSHEVDVVAKKDDRTIGAELKFHNQIGLKTDIKIALYVHARFEDIRLGHTGGKNPITEGMLITNTKFTKAAIDYGKCVGLSMIGWSYPQKGNLQDLIEQTGLHPLTCLTTLTNSQKSALLSQKIVLCKSIQESPKTLEKMGIKSNAIQKIIAEADILCAPQSTR